jgi:hypothetical protein
MLTNGTGCQRVAWNWRNSSATGTERRHSTQRCTGWETKCVLRRTLPVRRALSGRSAGAPRARRYSPRRCDRATATRSCLRPRPGSRVPKPARQASPIPEAWRRCDGHGDVRVELGSPPACVRLRSDRMLKATMPETAIHENGHLRPRQDNVAAAWGSETFTRKRRPRRCSSRRTANSGPVPTVLRLDMKRRTAGLDAWGFSTTADLGDASTSWLTRR